MSPQEIGFMKSIAKHVNVLNNETGELRNDIRKLKTDIGWIKRIVYYLAAIISIAVGKLIFFG